MKATITLFTLVTFLFTQWSFGKAKIPLPFGSTEKIIHVMDLPDTKEFQMADGRYYDVGSIYKIHHVLWLTYTHSTPELIGYLGNSKEYVVLTQEAKKAIANATVSDPQPKARVSFMDKIGSKIILGLIAFLAFYGLYTSYTSKVVAVEEERMVY